MRINFMKLMRAAFGLACLSAPIRADDAPQRTAPPVPATRTEMKEVLEGSKRVTPRLPLPPLTEEQQARAKSGVAETPGRGGLGGIINNGRMRQYYLLPEWNGGFLGRGLDGNASLGYTFQTMLFWIVSRNNNCTYCMGHQEFKLASEGVADDQIAALDCDWSAFAPKERAAFAFALKLTRTPQEIGPSDIDGLRQHYSDLQILEILMAVGSFNAMNRWTGPLRIPQEEHRVYLTPTSAAYRDRVSLVAPLDTTRSGSAPSCAAPANRAPLESRLEVEAALRACRERTPRLPLADGAAIRAALPSDWPAGPLPQWVRLLGNFPRSGLARAASLRASEEKGQLSRLLKAQIAWVAARQDRAWYALGQARRKLAALGQSDDAVFALDDPALLSDPAQRAALLFARKLTVDPALIDDADIEGLRKLYNDRAVAELIHLVTNAAFFNRLTEPAGLQLED